jgi:phage terminase small subunit
MSNIVPIIPPFNELPPAVQALKGERERTFCCAFIANGGNGAAAARAAGYSDASEGAKVTAFRLLQRDDIQRGLRELCNRYLFVMAPKALKRLNDLLDKPQHRHHAKAIDMVLNRTGFGERTQIDIRAHHLHEVVDHTQAAVDDLRKLKLLGVPHEKLIETFGYSGLARYEKLLAAEDAKLVEARDKEK